MIQNTYGEEIMELNFMNNINNSQKELLCKLTIN